MQIPAIRQEDGKWARNNEQKKPKHSQVIQKKYFKRMDKMKRLQIGKKIFKFDLLHLKK